MKTTSIHPNHKPSIKSQLATMGLPALMLTLGLAQPDQRSADIIVAGGTSASVEALAATQLCQPCGPCVVVSDHSLDLLA